MPPAVEPPAATGQAGPRYVPRTAVRRRRPPLPAKTRTDLAALTARLTPRDLWLIQMLHEHRVLTTHHITALAFTHRRTANLRLRSLYFLGAVDSFRPLLSVGTAAEHYVLGRAGADILAAMRATTPAALGWRTDLLARTAFSPTLGHDLAATTLLVTLATAGRTGSTEELAVWLSPRSAARLWGDWVRPDAYAHWRHSTTVLPFFLEHDTGTERPLTRVESKLPDYANLAATTNTRTAVLIHTGTTHRERALRARLAGTTGQLALPVATTSAELTTALGPSGPVWSPLHPPASASRLPLHALAEHWPDLVPALTPQTLAPPLGPHSDEAAAWRPIPPLPPAPAGR